MKKIIKVKHDVAIAVEDIGDGIPLVFIHGWPFNHQMFEYQYNYFLPRGYRVIGIDLRGFGASDLAIDLYGYDTFVDDIKSVLEELKVQDGIMIAFSTGGPIVARYLARHENYGIRKLVLISYGIRKDHIPTLIEECQSNRPKMIQEFVKSLFHQKPLAVYRDWLTHLALQASSYGTILAALAFKNEPLSDDLSKITLPTMICQGEKDTVSPLNIATIMKERIPQSFVVLFAKSGHAIFHDECEKLNRMMFKFIQK